MRTTLLLVPLVLALGMAGCGGKASPKKTTVHRPPSTPWFDRSYPDIEFGYIKSVAPLGKGYKLRLDLHLLFGPSPTGIQACIDDHACPPGTKGFLDDHWDHDLKFVLTYYLPPSADITLVGTSLAPVSVTAAQFYGLTRGQNPSGLKDVTIGAAVFQEFGYDLMVKPSAQSQFDTAVRLHQVFHP